jgi:hypothetical protein
MGLLCRYRHICLTCHGPHPFRHSKKCLAQHHLDVREGKKRRYHKTTSAEYEIGLASLILSQ